MKISKSFLFFTVPILEIFKKELRTFFHSYLGWFILCFTTLFNGLMGWWAIHKSTSSFEALQFIFYVFSGTSMVLGILIGMRLIAEERALGTIELLTTAPIQENQIILGKYTAAITVLILGLLASLPIVLVPVFFGGAKYGHIISGYLGNLLLGASSIAITIFYSSLSKSQLLAAVMATTNLVAFLLLGFFSPFVGYPMKIIIREFSLYVHYMNFEKGVVMLQHCVFFISIISFYLYLSIISLQTGRWK